MILIIYQTLSLPYSLAFSTNDNSLLDNITNGIFAFDIIIQFNTPIAHPDDPTEYITNRRVLAKIYATGWYESCGAPPNNRRRSITVVL